MAIPESTVEAAEENLKALLEEAFNGEVAFDPITVEATLDHYGEDNLEIVVVYENAGQLLDPHKLNTISAKLGRILMKLDFHNIPTESYIDKAEYAEWLELNRMLLWERYDL